MSEIKPCILMILDGWGISPESENNAVKTAKTPVLDKLASEYPLSSLSCSGESVGLPAGIMGNSEVGHLNIGAGRKVNQTLLRIDSAIQDGSFFENTQFLSVVNNTIINNTTLHLMGLVSDGGVHSQLKHLMALIDLAEQKGVENIHIHAILDGRDTPPDSGLSYIKELQDYIADKQGISIATICGRFYAMDRDTRWERTEKAYTLYTNGEGIKENDPVTAVKNAYNRNETDEFIAPVILNDQGIIKDNDGFIFFNFRADRARQITRAFTDNNFTEFTRSVAPAFCDYVCMSSYDATFDLPVAFGPTIPEDILGEIISKKGLKQLRIAETEKYAHVTYFFNGGNETPFDGEERVLIESPRDVETYDEKPEMSAFEVAEKLTAIIAEHRHDLIVVNFANMDMVGHTGIMNAAVTAVETVDTCVGKVIESFKGRNGAVIITADHGNSETMVDKNGGAHTAHTLNAVPILLVDDALKNKTLQKGCLGDIAPTVLEIMGVEIPQKMTGRSLLS